MKFPDLQKKVLPKLSFFLIIENRCIIIQILPPTVQLHVHMTEMNINPHLKCSILITTYQYEYLHKLFV